MSIYITYLGWFFLGWAFCQIPSSYAGKRLLGSPPFRPLLMYYCGSER